MNKRELTEEEIWKQITAKFSQLFDLEIQAESKEQRINDITIDRIGNISYRDKKHSDVFFEIKSFLTPNRRKGIFNMASKIDGAFVIIAAYISPEMKILLSNEKLNWMEASGDCSIHLDSFAFVSTGNKSTRSMLTQLKKKPNSYAKVLKVIIDNYDKFGEMSYRSIASLAELSVGSVHTTINKLDKEGVINKNSGGLKPSIAKEAIVNHYVKIGGKLNEL